MYFKIHVQDVIVTQTDQQKHHIAEQHVLKLPPAHSIFLYSLPHSLQCVAYTHKRSTHCQFEMLKFKTSNLFENNINCIYNIVRESHHIRIDWLSEEESVILHNINK